MASVQFRGVRDMQRRIADLSSKMKSNISNIVSAQAEQIRIKAYELCPYDANGNGPHLRDSIRVERAGVQQGRDTGGRFTSGTDVEARVVAGGPEFPYTAAVHEHPSLHDPPSWRGVDVHFTAGGPKFLERPFKEAVEGLRTNLKKIIE